MTGVENDSESDLNEKLSSDHKMTNRTIESRSKTRPIIDHQNIALETRNVQSVRDVNSNRPVDSRNPDSLVDPIRNENLSRPTEVRNQNLNRIDSVDSQSSSNQSDVPPETTLFEQIALQVHRYKGNFIYLQRLPGILNLLEMLFGLLTFTLILIACNNYYDPWQGIVISGFAGGKVEVFFFLTCTYAFVTTIIFTILILISNSYEKSLNAGNFNFIISFASFAFLMFSSVLLLIELSNRNTGILEFEHRFGVKVTCAVLGILNSLFYLLGSSIVFKIPSSHERPKHCLPQPI